MEDRSLYPLKEEDIKRGMFFAKMLISKAPTSIKEYMRGPIGDAEMTLAPVIDKMVMPESVGNESVVLESIDSVDNEVKSTLNSDEKKVLTIGSMFFYSIGEVIAGGSSSVSKETIKKYIDSQLNGKESLAGKLKDGP